MVLRLLNTKKESFWSHENDLKCHVLVQLVHLYIAGYANARRLFDIHTKSYVRGLPYYHSSYAKKLTKKVTQHIEDVWFSLRRKDEQRIKLKWSISELEMIWLCRCRIFIWSA